MRNAKYRVLIVGCVSIVFLLGVVLWRYFDPHRTFDVVTVNRDAGVLDRVTTRFEGYSFDVGILTPRMNGLNEKIFGHHYGLWRGRSLSNGLSKIIQNMSSKNSFPSRGRCISMVVKSYSL